MMATGRAGPMKAEIQSVIFDLDGLLLDTELIFRRVDSEAYAIYGGVVTDELRQQALGLTHEAKDQLFVNRLGLPVLPEAMSQLRAKMLEEEFRLAELMPGAGSLVATLTSSSVPLAVASSSTAAAIRLKLQRHQTITASMSAMVGCDHPRVALPKPAPDIFLAAAFELGVDPRHCLVFEDAPSGVEAAVAAGMWVVAVPDPALPPHPALAHAHQLLLSLLAFEPTDWGLA
ncbi:MAG: HAD-IA family hydrolase [Chloroflexi bacterium]|nr:HAD-IA family hydrolase [Chloroflexota bacterium]